jgi:XTP/dITP diphosphohydrolase
VDSPCRLLLATNNPGKVLEYRSLLAGISCTLITPGELGIKMEVAETGSNYAENACLKANSLARLSGHISLADDSGLEVDALNGEPGHFSARYAGEHATDRERVTFLLDRLDGVPWEKRTARFRCFIALAAPGGKCKLASGECHGIIALGPSGSEGFGYDPVFYFPEYGKTMAELPFDVKNQISHRGNAARQVAGLLRELLERDGGTR